MALGGAGQTAPHSASFGIAAKYSTPSDAARPRQSRVDCFKCILYSCEPFGSSTSSSVALPRAVQMFATPSRRKSDGDLLPCELHQVFKIFLESRRNFDLWDVVQVIIRHVTSKTAPSAELSLYVRNYIYNA